MDSITLHELTRTLGGALSAAEAGDLTAVAVSTDSRTLSPGDLFWALCGPNFDGHSFLREVHQRGAVAAVIDENASVESLTELPLIRVKNTFAALNQLAAWRRQRSPAAVVGVTGSVGKTTVKDWIARILSGTLSTHATRGNRNNQLGLPLTLIDLSTQHRAAVLELGAGGPRELVPLCELSRPDVGVVTAISEVHMERHGAIESIIATKGDLLESLPSGGLAVIRGDCPAQAELASRAKCRVMRVGEGSHCDLVARDLSLQSGRWRFRVDGVVFELPTNRRSAVDNALLTIAVGREFGLSFSSMSDEFRTIETPAGRGRATRCGSWTVLDDSYNASPLAMESALQALRDWPCVNGERRIAVLGDMRELGESGARHHRELGRRAAEAGCAVLFTLGRHADDIAAGAVEAGMLPERIGATPDFQRLAEGLRAVLKPGDVLLVKASRAVELDRLIPLMHRWAGDSPATSSPLDAPRAA